MDEELIKTVENMFAVRAEIRAGNMEKDKMDEMLTLTIQATIKDILRQKERLGMVKILLIER